MARTKSTTDTERTVLCVSDRLDSAMASFLADAGWQVEYAKTTETAERLIERQHIKVGLAEVPDDCTPQQLSALASCMAHVETNWVALIWPGQAENPLVSRFILDYCFDFATHPWANERLVFALGHAHGLSRLHSATTPLEPSLGQHGMVGQHESMQQLYRYIDKCSATDAPVFIAGESGTGKELTAQAVHMQSARSDRPFVAINCAAIPPSLLQSELFGHERGAFTGALQRKIGRIESADGGTLFLDEIGDMPHECQAVLLRFLQEGTIERVGGIESIHVNVRVVSATHVDLDRAIEEGRFRSDLYHRLCVLRLLEPPLRDRGEDIKLLANYALSIYRHDGARKLRGLSRDAIVSMTNYPWPGNVRELINCVRRAVVMSEGRFITAADLGLPMVHAERPSTLAEIRAKAEKEAIENALQRHGYKLTEAAAELGVSRATLYRLMNQNRLHQDGGARGAAAASVDASVVNEVVGEDEGANDANPGAASGGTARRGAAGGVRAQAH